MNDLTNKVAYITGGSKGIGYGIAKALLAQGMKVAITSRDLKAAKQATETLSTDPSKVLALESEVSSFDSEAKAIKATLDHFGQLDVLVANAGVGHFASIETLTGKGELTTMSMLFDCAGFPVMQERLDVKIT